MTSKIMMIGDSPEAVTFYQVLGQVNAGVISYCADIPKALDALRAEHGYHLVLLEDRGSYGCNRELASTIRATGTTAPIVFFKPYQPSRTQQERPPVEARRNGDKLALVVETFQDSSLVFEYRAPCAIKKTH